MLGLKEEMLSELEARKKRRRGIHIGEQQDMMSRPCYPNTEKFSAAWKWRLLFAVNQGAVVGIVEYDHGVELFTF